MNTSSATLVFLAVAGSILPGQDNPRSQGFVLEAGDHQIADVIESAAKFLGRNFIVQQSEIIGGNAAVSLQKSLNLDVLGCEEVVSQLAWMKGLVMSPVDPERGIYEFINIRGQRRSEIRSTFQSPEKVLQRPRLKIMVTTVVKLEHINAMTVPQYTRPFIHSGSQSFGLTVGSLGTRNSIMIKGLTDQVANLIRLVREMDIKDSDAPAAGVSERVVRLERERASLLDTLAKMRRRLDVLEGKKKRVTK